VAIRSFQVALFSVAFLTAACGKTEKQPEAAPAPVSSPAATKEKEKESESTKNPSVSGPESSAPKTSKPKAKPEESKPSEKAPIPVDAPKPDPELEAKVSAHKGYLSGVEGELAGYRTSIDNHMQKQLSLEKEIEQLTILQQRHSETISALDPVVADTVYLDSESVRKKIGAELIYACGQQIVQKLRMLRSELYQTVTLANGQKTPDFIDDILNEDPAVRQVNRKNEYLSHMMMADELYLDITDLVGKQKLQKKMYFLSGEKMRLYTRELQRKSQADASLAPHFFIQHELEVGLDEDFLSSLGAPGFMRKTGEYPAAMARARGWKMKVAQLKAMLLIEKPLSQVSTLSDLIE